MRRSTGKVIAFTLIACIVLSCSIGLIIGLVNMNRVPMPEIYDAYLAEKFWTKGDDEENKKFEDITDRYFHDAYKNSMLDLHYTVKDLEKYDFERPEMDIFSDTNIDGEALLNELHTLNRDKLSRKAQITYDIMEEDLVDALNHEAIPISSPFNSSSGIQTSLFTILTEYEFFVKEDVDDYIKLLSQIPEYLDYLYDYEKERVEKGYGMSDLMISRVIEQFKNVYSEGEDSAIISSFDDRMKTLPFLSEAQKQEYSRQNHDLVIKEMFPAYAKIEEKLALFLGMGVTNGALCNYENGQQYYLYEMKGKCGYGGTAEQLYAELYQYLIQIGLEFGAVKSTYPVQYNNWVNGEFQEPISTAEKTMEYFSKNLNGYFPEVSDAAYTVKYLSEAMGKARGNTLAYYMTPQIDNYQNGSITVNPTALNEKEVMYTVAHEGYPGHMYQSVYYYSQEPYPIRELFKFLGYGEGWAMYASNQADRIYYNAHNRGVYGFLNNLNNNYVYALHCIIDVMVNYYGWDSEKVTSIVNGIFLYYGWAASAEGIKNLCEAITLYPCVYLSYGVGNMMMEKMQQYAREQEGNKFDLVDFHKFILQVGPCNFGLLQKLEVEYYQIKKADLGEEYYK